MKALLYCVKAKPYLYRTPEVMNFVEKFFTYSSNKNLENCTLNGKIVAECDFEVEEIDFASERFYENDIEKYNIEINKQNELLKRSCLTVTQMVCYLDKRGKGQTNLNGYAIHIKNLHIFDEPRELSEYVYRTCLYGNCSTCKYYKIANCSAMQFPIKKAPQNMMYAFECIGDGGYINLDEVSKEPYILISIKPEWLCKILNGEKTIECRKRILKEMII